MSQAFNLLVGTILPNGTLTSEIDMREFSIQGAIATTSMTNGTLTFQVSPSSDADGGTYVDVKASDGTTVSLGPLSGTYALKGTDLEFLAPYHYVKIKTSVAQATGLQFKLPVKAHR